jgi:hypothetical protein|tara:strand:+ start:300 stop:800 length:501 start_codon:yes stop_codon:yes gene_type:complete
MRWDFVKAGLLSCSLLALVACGGDDDPVFEEINEELDVDIDYFDVDNTSLFPGEKTEIKWASEGAAQKFDVHVYVSEDSSLSDDDIEVIDEVCSFESDRHCEAEEDIVFECRYQSDNHFDCKEDGERLRETDLTSFLDVLPKSAYLILELCNDGDCETEVERISFN